MFRPDPDIISANESRATRIAVVAIAVPALLIGLIALVVAPWWLALILAVLVAAFMWWRASSAESKLLTAVGAKPADPKRHARLVNLADGLAVQAGVRVPELMVVDSDVANAMAVGRDERSAAVVVTSGLLDRLGRVELEGVLAQLFAELRSGDVELRTATYAHGAPLAAARAAQADRSQPGRPEPVQCQPRAYRFAWHRLSAGLKGKLFHPGRAGQ